MEYLPDEQAPYLENRKDPPFSALIDSMLLENPEHHLLDSYALRLLVHNKPSTYDELSSLMVASNLYVARCAVASASGEESVLTFTMQAKDEPSSASSTGISGPGNTPPPTTATATASLDAYLPPAQQRSTWALSDASSDHGSAGLGSSPEPMPGQESAPGAGTGEAPGEAAALQQMDDAPMGPPLVLSVAGSGSEGIPSSSRAASSGQASRVRGAGGRPLWRLARVRGESKHTRLPCTPSPEFAPEAVVEAQIEALQECCFERAYALLSPQARALVGPMQAYINRMARSRSYRPLVGHARATHVRRCQPSRNTYLEVVAVAGPGHDKANALYCWILTRHAGEGNLKDCWVTDWVKVVDDPKILAVLGIPAAGSEGGDVGGGGSKGPGKH